MFIIVRFHQHRQPSRLRAQDSYRALSNISFFLVMTGPTVELS